MLSKGWQNFSLTLEQINCLRGEPVPQTTRGLPSSTPPQWRKQKNGNFTLTEKYDISSSFHYFSCILYNRNPDTMKEEQT